MNQNGLMKDELGRKIMTEIVVLRPKTYSHLTDDNDEDKKSKDTKRPPFLKFVSHILK